MLDPNGADNLLAGTLPVEQLSIPRHINLAGNALYWYDDPMDDYKRDKANDTGALNAFIKVKTTDDVLRFARRYGPLGLCKHGLPHMHRGSWYRDVTTDGQLSGVTYTGEWNTAGGASERAWCKPLGKELLDRWVFCEKSYTMYRLCCSNDS